MAIDNRIKVFGKTDDVTTYPNAEAEVEGFKSGNLAYAVDVNTALRDATLIQYALIEAIKDKVEKEYILSPLSDITSTNQVVKEGLAGFVKQTILDIFPELQSQLQTYRKRQQKAFNEATSFEVEWNKTFDIITFNEVGPYTITYPATNNDIKESYEAVFTISKANTSIIVPEGTTFYSPNTSAIKQNDTTIQFGYVGTFMVTITVMGAGTYFMSITDVDRVVSIILDALDIEEFNATSHNGADTSIKVKVDNGNSTVVNYKYKLQDSDSWTEAGDGNIINLGPSEINIPNPSKLDKGNFSIQIYRDQFLETPTTTQSWTTSYTVDKTTTTMDGSENLDTRTMSITAPTTLNNTVTQIEYKGWWNDEQEPADFKLHTKGVSPYKETLTNEKANSRQYRVKARVALFKDANTVPELCKSEIEEKQFDFAAKTLPQLNKPTISLASTACIGSSSLSLKVTNPNNVAVTVFINFGSGYSQQSKAIAANSSATFNGTNSSNSGTAYAYLTAEGYRASETASLEWTRVTCCSCNTYCACDTCNCVSDCVCSCHVGPCSCDDYTKEDPCDYVSIDCHLSQGFDGYEGATTGSIAASARCSNSHYRITKIELQGSIDCEEGPYSQNGSGTTSCHGSEVIICHGAPCSGTSWDADVTVTLDDGTTCSERFSG